MKIEFTQPVALSDGRQFAAGDVADLDDAIALPSLNSGHAVAVKAKKAEKATAPAPAETATV